MIRVFIFLSFVSVLLAAAALISVLSVEDKTRVRGLPRFAWVIVVLCLPLLGSVAYFLVGRPRPANRSGSPWPRPSWPGGLAGPSRSPAPDDDPEFLRSLDQPPVNREAEDLRRWEEDLKRKDDGG